RARVGDEPLDASEQLGDGSQAGERAQRVRGGQEGEGVTRGRRVDDDEVAHRTATPPWLDPAEQPVQDQELAQPRHRRGQHLERRALEQPSREHAEAKHALDEVAEQGLGLEAGGREPGPDADRLGAEARHAEQRAERPAADLDREHVPSARRGGVRQRRRDGRLPHTALARDDDQALAAVARLRRSTPRDLVELADVLRADATESLLAALYRWWWRVETVGLERVPASGRVMLVANRGGALVPYEALMIREAVR